MLLYGCSPSCWDGRDDPEGCVKPEADQDRLLAPLPTEPTWQSCLQVVYSSSCSVLVSLESSGNVAFIWVSPPSCCSWSSSGTSVAPSSPLLPRGCSRVGGRVMLERRWGRPLCLDIPVACCVHSLWLQRWAVKSQDITARSGSLQLFCCWHCCYGIMGVLGWWQPLAKKQGVKSPLCAWHSCFAIISKFFFWGRFWKRLKKNVLQSCTVMSMNLSSKFFSHCKSVEHLWCKWSYSGLYKLQICPVPGGTFM